MEQAAEEIVPAQPPQPVHFVSGFVPLFVLDDSTTSVYEFIQSLNGQYQIFYLLADHDETITIKSDKSWEQDKVVKQRTPRLFKGVANLVGYAISPIGASATGAGLAGIVPNAWYSLPKVPQQLIADIDTFFRHVYNKLGTEAVVLLTYDPNFVNAENPSDGWGILVPEQNNTAASCSYDATTVIDEQPDHVRIVGTCHSHPRMQAFCSGTDKADQAEMDGLHITFGWPYGPTEHHIELQMGGQAYRFNPEQIFADYVIPEADDKIQGWSDKVTKKVVGGGVNQHYPTPPYTSAARKRRNGVPANAPFDPDILLCGLVAELPPNDDGKLCPACFSLLDTSHATSQNHTRCLDCMTYLMPRGSTLEQLRERRKQFSPTISNSDIDPEELAKAHSLRELWIWHIGENKTEGDTYTCVYSKSEKTTYRAFDDGDDDDDWVGQSVIKHTGKATKIEPSSAKKVEGGALTADGLADDLRDVFMNDYGCIGAMVCTECLHVQAVYEDDTKEDCMFCDKCGQLVIVMENDTYFPNPRSIPADIPRPRPYWVHGQYRLCCDAQDSSECTCGSQEALFDHVDEMVLDAREHPYNLDGGCEGCWFAYSPLCIPYRNWLKEWWTSRGPAAEWSLMRCEMFTDQASFDESQNADETTIVETVKFELP